MTSIKTRRVFVFFWGMHGPNGNNTTRYVAYDVLEVNDKNTMNEGMPNTMTPDYAVRSDT